MPRYNYICLACEKKALKKHRKALIVGDDGEKRLPDELFEQFVLFETSHGMNPTPKELAAATICPRCGGAECKRSLYDTHIHSYAKGYGWLDKDGIQRDMNLHKLTTDDPYAKLRQPGEVDDMKLKLKRAGQPKAKPIHNVPLKTMEKAVEQATKSSK